MNENNIQYGVDYTHGPVLFGPVKILHEKVDLVELFLIGEHERVVHAAARVPHFVDRVVAELRIYQRL